MTISDDRPASAAPPSPPPSFVRRHPILAGFGVLSGLSLFSALWPVSAVVISVAIAADATGLDRAAWSLTRSIAVRVAGAVRGHSQVVAPSPPWPSPPAPPEPQPPAPHREVHPPAVAAPRARREPRAHLPASRAPVRARHPRKQDRPVETRIDGRGL